MTLRKVWPEQYQVNAQKTSVHTDRPSCRRSGRRFAPVPVLAQTDGTRDSSGSRRLRFTPSVIYANLVIRSQWN